MKVGFIICHFFFCKVKLFKNAAKMKCFYSVLDLFKRTKMCAKVCPAIINVSENSSFLSKLFPSVQLGQCTWAKQSLKSTCRTWIGKRKHILKKIWMASVAVWHVDFTLYLRKCGNVSKCRNKKQPNRSYFPLRLVKVPCYHSWARISASLQDCFSVFAFPSSRWQCCIGHVPPAQSVYQCFIVCGHLLKDLVPNKKLILPEFWHVIAFMRTSNLCKFDSATRVHMFWQDRGWKFWTDSHGD